MNKDILIPFDVDKVNLERLTDFCFISNTELVIQNKKGQVHS